MGGIQRHLEDFLTKLYEDKSSCGSTTPFVAAEYSAGIAWPREPSDARTNIYIYKKGGTKGGARQIWSATTQPTYPKMYQRMHSAVWQSMIEPRSAFLRNEIDVLLLTTEIL